MYLVDLKQLPDNFVQYIHRQIDTSARASRNANLAERIAENIKKTKSDTDGELRVSNIMSCVLADGKGATNPVQAIESFDPVYRKIAKIEHIASHSLGGPSYKYEASIKNHADRLRMHLEGRRMGEEEYTHLLKTSINKLIDEWCEKFAKQYAEAVH